MTPVCEVLKEPTEFIVHIFETDDRIPPLLLGEPTYRLGPFKTYEEADDAIFVAIYQCQDDDVFWHPVTIEQPIKRRKSLDECDCS